MYITLVKKIIINKESCVVTEKYEKDLCFPDGFVLPPIGSNIEVKFLYTQWSSVTAINFHTRTRQRINSSEDTDVHRIYCDLNDHDSSELTSLPSHYKSILQKDGWEFVKVTVQHLCKVL